MIKTEIMIIGGGPAGMSAAIAAASSGARVLLCERRSRLGGRLNSDVHTFVAGARFAGSKGFEAADALAERLGQIGNVDVWTDSAATGYYEDGVVTVVHDGDFVKVFPKRLIVAAGAEDGYLAFENNDLPGIISAGTAQELLNAYGIAPGSRVLIAGAGRLAAETAEDLVNAGIGTIIATGYRCSDKTVKSMIDALADKGAEVYEDFNIFKALGNDKVKGAVICRTDRNGQIVNGTAESINCDAIVLAADRTPAVDLAALTECRMAYVEELGGYVPETDSNMETSSKGIYAAGDCAGIENANAAVLEGEIAGFMAAASLGLDKINMIESSRKTARELEAWRSDAAGARIIAGHEQFGILSQGGK